MYLKLSGGCVKFHEIKRVFEAHGFYQVKSKKHFIFTDGKYRIPLPNNAGKDVNKMLLKRIFKQLENISLTRTTNHDSNAITKARQIK